MTKYHVFQNGFGHSNQFWNFSVEVGTAEALADFLEFRDDLLSAQRK
jgi:hypothetical protein